MHAIVSLYIYIYMHIVTLLGLKLDGKISYSAYKGWEVTSIITQAFRESIRLCDVDRQTWFRKSDYLCNAAGDF